MDMKLRKKYVGVGILLFGLLLSVLLVLKVEVERRSSSESDYLYLASFFEELEDGRVQCNLCPNRCILAENQRGLCGVRENIGGKLYSLVYGKPVTTHIDPMEKKPMFHFLPGKKIYSLATAGCNLDCKYCQNWDIAHRKPEDVKYRPMTPEEVVEEAISLDSTAIAFTYNEPTVWYEYMYDIARLAKEKGLRR